MSYKTVTVVECDGTECEETYEVSADVRAASQVVRPPGWLILEVRNGLTGKGDGIAFAHDAPCAYSIAERQIDDLFAHVDDEPEAAFDQRLRDAGMIDPVDCPLKARSASSCRSRSEGAYGVRYGHPTCPVHGTEGREPNPAAADDMEELFETDAPAKPNPANVRRGPASSRRASPEA